MKAIDVEICALANGDTYTLGRGRDYGAAIEDARRRAKFRHSLCAIVLTWKSPLIRAYSRPQHRFGVIVPCSAIEVHAAPEVRGPGEPVQQAEGSGCGQALSARV